ncbi:solute carrier family 22 member 1-like [Battus philenor]|uniref:solute carrier family 22 member 1-like n=1 Tax=Battus philenor TaxID=42288 RepID=UPI0035D00701
MSECNDSGHYNYNISNNCTQYAYENPNSFVAEFQLGGSEWKRTLVGTAHCFGYMLGLLVVGPLSDKFGRRDIIVATAIFCGIFGLAKSFSPWYWLYIALEFTEAAIGDSCSPTYIFVTELVSRNHRINFILICTFGFVFGGLTLALSAWLVPYWRYLLRVVYTPVLLFVAYKFILIESPRWLFNNGRKQEAISLLEKIAKKTKVKIDKDSLEMITFEDPKEVVFMQILKNTFKSKLLRRRFFVCLSWWITSTFVNYGLAINSVLLQGNKYLNYAFVILMEIPGYFILAYVLNNFKRKLPLIFGFFIAGILCISQPFIPLYGQLL